jgi:glutaredoxin 3
MTNAKDPSPGIVVYTRTLCIWCWRVKRLLRRNGLRFEERPAGSPEVRAWLLERTGRPTVPQVFVDDVAVGGFEATSAWLQRAHLRSGPSAG